MTTSKTLTSRYQENRWQAHLFKAYLLISITAGFVLLGALITKVLIDGSGVLTWDFLTSLPSTLAERAGARVAILATIYLGLLLLAFAVPIGVATALYLEEYANRKRFYNLWLEINIQNLAGVPSIVYGILGLAFLVRGLSLGRVLLAGALILTLLVLPTVIVASREAIRAVPSSIRHGALALGATHWQMVSRQVIPAAIPGIATGMILSLARAIGETAPLLLVGALSFVTVNPSILGDFTALPVQIFQWISRPQDEFRAKAAAAIIVLLIILLLMNSFAVWIRNRYERKW